MIGSGQERPDGNLPGVVHENVDERTESATVGVRSAPGAARPQLVGRKPPPRPHQLTPILYYKYYTTSLTGSQGFCRQGSTPLRGTRQGRLRSARGLRGPLLRLRRQVEVERVWPRLHVGPELGALVVPLRNRVLPVRRRRLVEDRRDPDDVRADRAAHVFSRVP